MSAILLPTYNLLTHPVSSDEQGCTHGCLEPYPHCYPWQMLPFWGVWVFKGIGKPTGHPQVYIQKLTIGIELIYRIHIYTTTDTLQKLISCKSCSPALVCVCPPSFVFAFTIPHSCLLALVCICIWPPLFMFACPCSCSHLPTTVVLLL